MFFHVSAKQDDFDFIITTDKTETTNVYECYPDAFKRVYQGKSCSVYEVAEEGFLRGVTGWSPELVCEKEVPVIREIRVTDLYSRLTKECEMGNLILHRYDTNPEYKKMIYEHILDRLVLFDAFEYIQKEERFQMYDKDIIRAVLAGKQHAVSGIQTETSDTAF